MSYEFIETSILGLSPLSKTDSVCGHFMHTFVGDELDNRERKFSNSILKLFKI